MAWNNTENVVKKDGKCWNRGRHKYCYYWRAKHDILISGRQGGVRGFRCALFKLDKKGYASLPICNQTYGKTFDGRIDGTTTL